MTKKKQNVTDWAEDKITGWSLTSRWNPLILRQFRKARPLISTHRVSPSRESALEGSGFLSTTSSSLWLLHRSPSQSPAAHKSPLQPHPTRMGGNGTVHPRLPCSTSTLHWLQRFESDHKIRTNTLWLHSSRYREWLFSPSCICVQLSSGVNQGRRQVEDSV